MYNVGMYTSHTCMYYIIGVEHNIKLRKVSFNGCHVEVHVSICIKLVVASAVIIIIILLLILMTVEARRPNSQSSIHVLD